MSSACALVSQTNRTRDFFCVASRIASAIAGVWFVLFFGLALVYPLSDVLRWGVACFLRARAKAEGIPVGQLKLRPEEWDALVA